jgi:hypothetical protein
MRLCIRGQSNGPGFPVGSCHLLLGTQPRNGGFLRKHFQVYSLRAHSPRAAAHAVVIQHCLRSLVDGVGGFKYDPALADRAFLAVSRRRRTHGYVLQADDGLRLLNVETTEDDQGAWETFDEFEELRSIAN